MPHIIIIGNGIAGITAARHIRKLSDHRITVISGESEHFFSRTALMYIYMGHMKYEHTKPYEDWFWKKNRISLVYDWVEAIDFDQKSLHLKANSPMSYDQLILATGSKSNKFGWPGQDLEGVQGLYSLQDLELMEKNTRNINRAVIVGGGLIGVEMAEMLHSRGIHVTCLIREKNFWGNVLPAEEGSLIDHHLRTQGIELIPECELEKIEGDSNGKVQSITTTSGHTISCQFVGLTVGVSPNIDLVRNTSLQTDKGILVDEMLQTSVPGVYAIGDCVQVKEPLAHRKPTEAVWYAGRMMGETVAQTICGNPTPYHPGVWFNSAKFFDIEYQTYGNVPATLPENMDAFYWESEDRTKCIKITFDKASGQVAGVNVFGIRIRHEVWEQWIKNSKTLSHVIQHLPKANFDPEFFRKYESEIQTKYNEKYPDNQIPLRKKGFLEKILG